ncbi:MAG: type II toxin-antitoxin system VapC family toxin [Candidatus Bathyarchaeia archaeon]
MKVIDSSSLTKFFSREEGWQKVEKILLEGAVTLDLSIKEVANALWKKVLSQEAKIEDVEEILKDLIKSNAIKLHCQEDYLIAAFRIAVKHKITVYDSLFIELAKSINLELVTSDDEQAEIAKKEGIKVMKV